MKWIFCSMEHQECRKETVRNKNKEKRSKKQEKKNLWFGKRKRGREEIISKTKWF